MHHLLISDLRTHCRGEILSDAVNLAIYSTDASMYQIRPVVVVIPHDEEDLITAVKIAYDHRIPIIPRGGGTGLAGQAIGEAMILDLSKNFRNITSLNVDNHWVIVEPGVVRDVLNEFLAPHKLHFAPDPATSSRANIGGMIANNSSGTKSIIYGKTIDHVLEIKVLLSDGTILYLKEHPPEEYEQIAKLSTREGEIYREIKLIVKNNLDEIKSRFPTVMRRVGGYNLDEFSDTDHWNLSKLIVGSEGTLGIILEAKIKLTPLPSCTIACLSHFDSMNAAIRAVQEIIKYHPAAVEIIDHTVINLSRQNIATRDSCRVIEGDPAAVLIIEFHGEDEEETFKQVQTMAYDLQLKNIGYAHPVFKQGQAYTDILNVRKKDSG
ncbi:MAG: FAD-binding oxidoreductase [Saprospiraceae bacterium]|nr:FAD-binding oxidoreductase [Saprospiraceae bacterium]